MKNRVFAAILAFVFGIFGVHKFYLRDPGAGVLYLALFFITSRLMFPVSAILGIIDGIRYLSMTDEAFDKKFNQGIDSQSRRRTIQRNRRQPRHVPYEEKINPTRRRQNRSNPFKKSGLKKYKEFDLEEAIIDFKKGLEIQPDDIALHFNIACAFSLTEQKDLAFTHLSMAVEKGFNDFDKIKSHDDLAFIRIQPEFEAFQANNYQLGVKNNPTKPPQKEAEIKDDKLLSQLNKLAELRQKGLLSDDEFNLEKEKLLRR